MRSSARIVSSLALALLVASIASAEPIVVIRGSEVSVEEGNDGDAPEKRRRVVAAAPLEDSIAPAPVPAAVQTPPTTIVFVDARAYPQVAWAFVNPWEENGIRVHGPGRHGASKVATHGRWSLRETSQIRIHTGSERTVAAIGPGGGGSHIKVHRMGARAPSRIRVHGAGSWGR